tara:strand:- start:4934 stop:5122 length:189 start_codon:yes stop_codon:yes gene_type:complete
MKRKLTREQMIALIASDYGYDLETTNKIKTEILREVCNSYQPYIHLKALLELRDKNIFIKLC